MYSAGLLHAAFSLASPPQGSLPAERFTYARRMARLTSFLAPQLDYDYLVDAFAEDWLTLTTLLATTRDATLSDLLLLTEAEQEEHTLREPDRYDDDDLVRCVRIARWFCLAPTPPPLLSLVLHRATF